MTNFTREHDYQKNKIFIQISNHVHRKRHGHRSFYFTIEVASYLLKIKGQFFTRKIVSLDENVGNDGNRKVIGIERRNH